MTEEIDEEPDYSLDFTTSSAISRVNIKFLAVYIPIIWFSGLGVGIFAYEWFRSKPPITENWTDWIFTIIFLPVLFFVIYLEFVFLCLFFSKLMLVLVNLIHKPKEGVFKAEIGDTDFEFWCLRTELKKLALWLVRNFPLTWIDALAFRWFGVKMDFSSHLNDAWVDCEFVKLGHSVTVGQGAVVMSSMVVGKYLIIKRIVIDDYAIVGGHATLAPGTYMGKDSLIGALSTTTFKNILEPNWIYFGIPAIKLKENKYHELRREVIMKRDVDHEQKFEVEQEINIDDDKKDLVVEQENNNENKKDLVVEHENNNENKKDLE